MTTAVFFMLYPVIFIAGAILTQFTGNAHRPLHEGFLAWLFLPIGLIACLSSLATEGVKGLKFYFHEFAETLLNIKYGESQAQTPEKNRAHHS